LAYSFVPWILFLIPATKFIFVQYFERMENQTMRALACLYCYALVLFLVLSCSGTQMDTYLLPAIPMLSIVVAFYLNDACLAISSPEPQFRAINLISNMLAIFAGILLLSLPIFMISPIVPALKTPFSLIIFIVAAGYLIQYWLKKKNKLIAMLTMFCGTTAFACILIFHVICHFVDQAGQKDLKDLCLPYKKTENQLCIFHAFKPSVLFYTERPVDSFFYPGELIVQSAQDKANMGADASKLLLFTSDQYIPLLQSLPHLSLKLLAHRGNWQVFLVENAHLMKHLTLEEMFRQTSVISNIFKQQGNWGPLTVPYTAGDRR
jgi:hypothetical protein